MVGFKKPVYENVPEGAHPFRCYAVIDLGTQEREFGGEKYLQPEVNFLLEFPTELMSDGRPFTMKAASFNFSVKLTSKSKLLKFLKAWLPSEKIDESYDFAQLIGKPGVANVVHDISGNGNVYANIASVMPPMKGMEVPPLVNQTIYVSLDDKWNQSEFDKLTQYWQDIIKGSPEFNEIMNNAGKAIVDKAKEKFPGAEIKTVKSAAEAVAGDEIPF